MPQDQPSYAQAHEARKSPSKVEADNAPGGALLQVPVPRAETENKLSHTESKVGKYSDKIRMAPFTGRAFHEEETKLTKI